jgi:hypothetical protein
MKITEVKNLTTRERFLYWILEREQIRLRRELGQNKPWTDDEILQSYKFCNVRRMDDRVSQWLLRNWYVPFANHQHMITAVTLARQLNNTESLEVVGFPEIRWNPLQAERILNERAAAKKKNFAAAYMITGTLGGTKVQQIVHKVVTPMHKAVKANFFEGKTRTMQEFWESLLPFAGFSSFISGQVVADLRWAIDGDWADRDTWAPMGPGSKRGLNRFFEKDKNDKMNAAEFRTQFDKLLDFCTATLPTKLRNRLEAMDIQNCLCEFDKYERTLWEGRRPKQRYQGK